MPTNDILQTLAGIRTYIGLAAVVCGFVAWLAWGNKLTRTVAVTLGAILAITALYSYAMDRGPTTYHVRVTVVDPQGRAVDDARVVTKSGNEALKVPGGYQIDISSDKLPPDRRIEFIATEGFNIGEGHVDIASEANPTVTIQLAPKITDVMVGGIVEDARHNGLEGVQVQVVDSGDHVTTEAGGHFSLKAGAPVGKKVLIQAQKKGYAGVKQYEEAGNSQVVLTMKR